MPKKSKIVLIMKISLRLVLSLIHLLSYELISFVIIKKGEIVAPRLILMITKQIEGIQIILN